LSSPAPSGSDPRKQLLRVMGFWDVTLFNVATVLGPRWIAAAGHNGASSISLWVLAAIFFFVPTGLVVMELSTRFPQEGGLYVWSKEAFGEFHGFVAGWTYWVYTFFYFPGLLMASASMAAYVGGAGAAPLANDRTFILVVSFVILLIALVLNLIGLRIGKWLQNAGGAGTILPLLMLMALAGVIWYRHGAVTSFSWRGILPRWDFATVNFWPQIFFAFTGLELVSSMSEEVRNPEKTFPRAIVASGAAIAAVYILGTVAVLALLPARQVDVKSGAFQALTYGSTLLGIGFFGMAAALLVSIGNAGGVGSTVAGIARVPFVVGIDRYMPKAFGKIHPRWKTPHVSMLIQAAISAAILLAIQVNETTSSAYQILVDAAVILYFIPFLYMYLAVIKLAYRRGRATPGAILIPGGRPGVWISGLLGFAVVLFGIALSFIPPGETANKFLFEVKLIGGTVAIIALGLVLYFRGAREKSAEGVVAAGGAVAAGEGERRDATRP
jgi:amino acid transporter